ncbi:Multidomain esterase like protein [Verticillium longisporum]|nr:Multidomain esterase like protein [Verticillium longisporum]
MKPVNIGISALKLGIFIVNLTQAATAFSHDIDTPNEDLLDHRQLLPRSGGNLAGRAEARDFFLRIMPVGASIVRGDPAEPGDTDKNGFRKAVRDKLRWDGWKVNMVGSLSGGTMADNNVEAIPGERIDQIHTRLRTTAPVWQPNLYLINAGTNDASQDMVAGAGERMKAMIDTIFSITPDATVILSTLLHHRDFQPRVVQINDQYRRLVKSYQGGDLEKPTAKVFLAEMQDDFLKFPEDFHDPLHPNRGGFRKMAAVWVWAIDQVNGLNWLNAPKAAGFTDDEGKTMCKKEPGSELNHPHGSEVKLLFAGDSTIRDDGVYKQSSQERGVVWKNKVSNETEMYWAHFIDSGLPREQVLDELVLINRDTDRIDIHINRGDGKFDAGVRTSVGHHCVNRGIHFGDVNGDGLDDYICIASDGTPFVAINNSTRQQTVPSFGVVFKWRDPIVGYAQDRVRLGDIDGDGRLDYCVIRDGGNIHIKCYRNGGLGNEAAYWQDLGSGGPVFSAKDMGDIRGVRLVSIWENVNGGNGGRWQKGDGARWGDVTGTGFDDYIWISAFGEVTIFPNKARANSFDWYKSVAWGSTTLVKTGVTRRALHIADWNGDGKADIIAVDRVSGELTVWLSTSEPGKVSFQDAKKYSDTKGFCTLGWGVLYYDTSHHFADINGDGRADYISIGQINYTKNLERADFRFADVNGDGLSDIIHSDRFTGNTNGWVFFNTCPAGGDDPEGVLDPSLPPYTPGKTPETVSSPL